MSANPYVIVIDVPKPENTCFVAMPMGKDESNDLKYSGIYDVIQSVANRNATNGSPIIAFRTDENVDRDIPIKIVNGIRSAKIIVAIIGPDKQAIYNPNVMYELGMAHALGKPTIILKSSNIDTEVPFDISHYEHIEYDDDLTENSKKQDLKSKLYKSMKSLLDTEKAGLVDPTWEGINVEIARLCSSQKFRANLKTFFSFSQELQKHIQEPKKVLESLSQEVGEVYVTGIIGKGQAKRIIKIWEDHNRFYGSIPNTLLWPVEKIEETFNNSMNDLFSHANKYQAEKGCVIQKAREFYKHIRYHLKRYSNLQLDITNKLSSNSYDDFENMLRDQDFNCQLHLSTKDIFATTNAILIKSNNMVSSLIDVFD